MYNTNTISNYDNIIADFLDHHPDVTMTIDQGTENNRLEHNGEYLIVGAEQNDDGDEVGYTYTTYENADDISSGEYSLLDGSTTLDTLADALESWHDMTSNHKD